MSPKKITKLKDAIRETHGCESLHIESVPVKEVFEGETAWEGTVEVFDLVGHPKASRAYAWSYRDGDEMKSIAVLHLAPVDSPQAAVKVAIREQSAVKIELTRMLFLDQNHSCRSICAVDENARGSNRTPIASWRMEALRCLRG